MNRKDERALAAIRYTIEQDIQVREDIKRSLEYHDRVFFAQVVYRVVDRLQLSVVDMRGFVEGAYERFKGVR